MAHIIIIVLLVTILVVWTFSASVYVYAALQDALLTRTMRKMNKVVKAYVEAYIAANNKSQP